MPVLLWDHPTGFGTLLVFGRCTSGVENQLSRPRHSCCPNALFTRTNIMYRCECKMCFFFFQRIDIYLMSRRTDFHPADDQIRGARRPRWDRWALSRSLRIVSLPYCAVLVVLHHAAHLRARPENPRCKQAQPEQGLYDQLLHAYHGRGTSGRDQLLMSSSGCIRSLISLTAMSTSRVWCTHAGGLFGWG